MILPAFEAQGGTVTRNIDVALNQSSNRSELMDLMAEPRRNALSSSCRRIPPRNSGKTRQNSTGWRTSPSSRPISRFPMTHCRPWRRSRIASTWWRLPPRLSDRAGITIAMPSPPSSPMQRSLHSIRISCGIQTMFWRWLRKPPKA